MPSLRTTVVGSYPVPDWLRTSPNEDTQLDAIALAMRAQERAGIDVISDGEINRWDLARNAPGGMVERFVRPMSGVSTELSLAQLAAFHARSEMAYRKAPPGIVTGPIGAGLLDLPREWRRARRLTARPLKFTLTSPYMMARTLADEHYPGVRELALALAGVLAEQVRGIDAAVVQVDEPNLPGSPGDGPIAAEAINAVLDAVPGAGEKAVHLCFGNYGGQTVQKGSYDRLIAFMNALRCDHLVLETTRRPADELRWLREVRPQVRFAVGVIDVKDLQIESPETVARRAEALAGTLGSERLAYLCPDCGLRMLPRPVADGKLAALVAGRDLFSGRATRQPSV